VGTVGTNIFISYLPADNPDLCLALFEYAGSAIELTLDSTGDENPGLQVRGRSAAGDYKSGFDLMKTAQAVLHGLSNTTLTGISYKLVRANHSIAFMGFDEKSRPEWVQNYSVMKTI
jgi:hypothetical protein